jgi:hypothetical protein
MKSLGKTLVLASLTAMLTANLTALTVSTAQAEQRRDWMIAPQPDGTDLFVDLILPGAQLTAEHRIPIYGFANQLTFRGNALYTAAFYESQADVDLRILALTLGATYGFRSVLRNMQFEEGERLDRDARRKRTVDGDFDKTVWGFFEGRARLSLPINEYVVFDGINALRIENRPDRTLDWRTGVVHDGGTFWKSDWMLFFKHEDWGGLAPMMQFLNFELGDRRYTQFNYGFMLATRPGLQRADDILALQVLIHPGGSLGGVDNGDVYGLDVLFSPVTFFLAYRTVLPLWRPE